MQGEITDRKAIFKALAKDKLLNRDHWTAEIIDYANHWELTPDTILSLAVQDRKMDKTFEVIGFDHSRSIGTTRRYTQAAIITAMGSVMT